MEFTTLAKMKKSFPWCKTSDGKQTVLFDLSNLDKTWFTESIVNQIMPDILKNVGRSSYESVCFTSCLNDDSKLFIDLEFDRMNVYKKETGKKLYTLKSIAGFRISRYKLNIYGVVPDSAKPVSVVTYGTYDNYKSWWTGSTSKDVEI